MVRLRIQPLTLLKRARESEHFCRPSEKILGKVESASLNLTCVLLDAYCALISRRLGAVPLGANCHQNDSVHVRYVEAGYITQMFFDMLHVISFRHFLDAVFCAFGIPKNTDIIQVKGIEATLKD